MAVRLIGATTKKALTVVVAAAACAGLSSAPAVADTAVTCPLPDCRPGVAQFKSYGDKFTIRDYKADGKGIWISWEITEGGRYLSGGNYNHRAGAGSEYTLNKNFPEKKYLSLMVCLSDNGKKLPSTCGYETSSLT
ncbi:hypothetical protein ACWEO9_01490 [Streptomyces albidoflavus]